eukprot:5606313-Pleurochrysis_carterae.AAC.2
MAMPAHPLTLCTTKHAPNAQSHGCDVTGLEQLVTARNGRQRYATVGNGTAIATKVAPRTAAIIDWHVGFSARTESAPVAALCTPSCAH